MIGEEVEDLPVWWDVEDIHVSLLVDGEGDPDVFAQGVSRTAVRQSKLDPKPIRLGWGRQKPNGGSPPLPLQWPRWLARPPERSLRRAAATFLHAWSSSILLSSLSFPPLLSLFPSPYPAFHITIPSLFTSSWTYMVLFRCFPPLTLIPSPANGAGPSRRGPPDGGDISGGRGAPIPGGPSPSRRPEGSKL